MTQGRMAGYCTCHLCKRWKGNKRDRTTDFISRVSMSIQQSRRERCRYVYFKQIPARFRNLYFLRKN